MSTDANTLLLFHKLVHCDERVAIEPWREESDACGGARRCRSVVYKLPMRGPAWFRRLCGAPPAYYRTQSECEVGIAQQTVLCTLLAFALTNQANPSDMAWEDIVCQ